MWGLYPERREPGNGLAGDENHAEAAGLALFRVTRDLTKIVLS